MKRLPRGKLEINAVRKWPPYLTKLHLGIEKLFKCSYQVWGVKVI